MKKTIIILVCLLVPVAVFAHSFFNSSFGICFINGRQTVFYEGETASSTLKGSQLSIALNYELFGENSDYGLDVGINLLYPLSAKVDGIEIETDFLNVGWCPRIGLAWKYEIDDQLTMVSSIGYEILFRYQTERSSGTTTSFLTTMHGIYGQDYFNYELTEKSSFILGMSLYAPLFVNSKISVSGYGSETYNSIFAGMFINPFVGFYIKR